MKSPGSTGELRGKLDFLRQVGVHGTLSGAVECVDIKRNAEAQDSVLGLSRSPQMRRKAFGGPGRLRCESVGSERD